MTRTQYALPILHKNVNRSFFDCNDTENRYICESGCFPDKRNRYEWPKND